MATNESTRRRGSPLGMIVDFLAIVLVVGFLFLTWPYIMAEIQARLTGAMPVVQPMPTAVVATPRPFVSIPRPQSAPAQEAQPAAPVIPADVQYNATAEAVYQQAVETQRIIEENNAMPVDPVGVKQQPAKSDWCSGSHLDNPECQPGNGQKVER